MKKWVIIGMICLIIMNTLFVGVASGYEKLTVSAEEEFDHHTPNEDLFNNDKDQNNDRIEYISKFDMKSDQRVNNNLKIYWDYQIKSIIRGTIKYDRLLIRDGGLECGIFGEERPFYQFTIFVAGNGLLEQVSVKLDGKVTVNADVVPYLIPQKVPFNEEVISQHWSGQLERDVNSDWSIHHLSKDIRGSIYGELYSLKIYPVEYYTNGTVQIFTSASIQYSTLVNNMWFSNNESKHKPTGSVKYLIITHPDLASSVESFAQWKSQKGLVTKVATTEEIDEMYDEGDLPLKMRKYIQGMESNHDLDYLLLVGDWDKVPTRNTKNSYAQPMMGEPDNFASDLYFACVDPNTTWNKDGDPEIGEDGEIDDCIPDMANGRLAINSPQTVSKVLEALVEREKNLTWSNKTMRTAYMCGDPGYLPGDPTDVMDHFWTTYGDDIFTGNDTIYYDGSGNLEFSSKSFKKVVDFDHQAMCYFGHGQPTGFPDLFEVSDVSRLSNIGPDGSLFAMACLTSFFDDPSNGKMVGAIDNCFAEVLTESPDKGLVGFIGSSRMAVGSIDTTYSGDAPGLEEDYWRAIRAAALGNLTPNIGAVWRRAVTSFSSSFFPFTVQGFDNPSLRTFLEYNLLGEPEAPLILREPENFSMKFEVASDKKSIWVKVTNDTGVPMQNAVVSIYRYNELSRVLTTCPKGEVTIPIPPNNGGIINLTASRPGDNPTSDTFMLPDNLEPMPKFSIEPEAPDGNNSYYLTSPIVTLFGDEPVDIEYRIDDGPVTYCKDQATFEVPNGTHTVYYRAVDRENQWSPWAEFTVYIDSEPPELEIVTVPEYPDGMDQWFITKPYVDLNSNEPLGQVLVKLNDGKLKPKELPMQLDEGTYDIKLTAYDLAGNPSSVSTSLKVDLTPPNSESNISHPPDGRAEIYITIPTIKLTSPDNSCNLIEYRWNSGIWSEYTGPLYPPEGVHDLVFRGRDEAGNYEEPNKISFNLDTTVPKINLTTFPAVPDGANQYYLDNPIIDMELIEESGELYYVLVGPNEEPDWDDQIAYEDIFEVPDGDWNLYVKAVDLAGNPGYYGPTSLKVDTIPPTLTWEVLPKLPNGENGWYKRSPEIILNTDSDDTELYWIMDEMDTWITYDQELTISAGIHRVQFKAVDSAGNEYYNETAELKVDLLSPEIMMHSPIVASTVGPSVFINWSGTDDVSGIGQYKVKLNGDAWIETDTLSELELDRLSDGYHRIKVKAVDLAGNSNVVSVGFNVDATSPKVLSHTPTGAEIFVDTEIIITFSEDMKRDSVNVELPGISGSVFWENNSIIFTPSSNLEYSTKYLVKITGKDIYNNPLGFYSWSFKTENEPEDHEDTSTVIPWALVIGIIVGSVIAVSTIGVVLKYKNRWSSKSKEEKTTFTQDTK